MITEQEMLDIWNARKQTLIDQSGNLALRMEHHGFTHLDEAQYRSYQDEIKDLNAKIEQMQRKLLRIERQLVSDCIQELTSEILELGATRSNLDRLGGLYIRSYQLELKLSNS